MSKGMQSVYRRPAPLSCLGSTALLVSRRKRSVSSVRRFEPSREAPCIVEQTPSLGSEAAGREPVTVRARAGDEAADAVVLRKMGGEAVGADDQIGVPEAFDERGEPTWDSDRCDFRRHLRPIAFQQDSMDRDAARL